MTAYYVKLPGQIAVTRIRQFAHNRKLRQIAQELS